MTGRGHIAWSVDGSMSEPVGGTAVALVAACRGVRRAAAHAQFSLRLDSRQSIEGTADDLVRAADELARQRHRYVAALVAATGQPDDIVAREIDRGRAHRAAEAVTLGIVDVIVDGS
ncbi:MAG: ATP-dependent Clp protease proteolytic subunit [Acidimicrobiales bacterium]